MSTQRKINLLKELVNSGYAFIETIEQRDPMSDWVHATALRSTGLLRSIILLIEADEVISAEVLARTLLETSINSQYLRKMYDTDGRFILQAYVDASTLQKFRLVQNVDWNEDWRAKFPNWVNIIDDIKSRYSAEEFDRLKRRGLYGKSLEERAKALGLDHWYDSGYREWSKNVHGWDWHAVLSEIDANHTYLRDRLNALLAVLPSIASGIYIACNEILKSESTAPQNVGDPEISPEELNG